MKKLIPAVIAAVALTACSDDVVNRADNSSDNIRFRTAVTRASEVTTDNISTFWAKAVNADDNSEFWSDSFVKFNKENGEFVGTDVSESSLKWPKETTFNFYTTNLDPQSYPVTVANNKQTMVFKPATNAPDQVDFVYATNKGTRDDYPNTVPLVFKHALCQIAIKAKCESDEYTVKVKGYKIHHLFGQATFTFPTPKKVGSTLENADEATAQDAGTWASYSLVNSQVADYYSGIMGGYNADATTIHDDNEYNFITLSKDAKTISNGDGGSLMVIPQGPFSGWNQGNNNGKNQGFYIALLVQIDKKDANRTPIYPSYEKGSTTRRVSYRGLPKYYGYIYVPIDIDWSAGAGKKYTYTLDLSDGLGYVDPVKPDTVDPDTYNPTDDTNPGTGGTDQYDPQDPVVGRKILYNLSVTDWDTTVTVKEEI
jgi:hypothetical protein